MAPGTAVDYQITITNQDSAACGQATFDLNAAIPAGWSATYNQDSLALATGASDTALLTVIAPAGTPNGFYEVTATVSNRIEPARFASVTTTYVVEAAPANQPPVATDDSAATLQRSAVTIDVLANDVDPDGDLLSIISATNGANGNVTINPDGSLTYAPKGKFTGTDWFEYRVSDGIDSAMALVAITVSKPTGDSGGGGGGGGKGGGKTKTR